MAAIVNSRLIRDITLPKAKNLHILVNPHICLGIGWRSNINFETEAEWDLWFETYRNNFLHLASLAERTEVELLCLGTELKSAMAQRPEFCVKLSKGIKRIYKGRLTYEFNWNDPIECIRQFSRAIRLFRYTEILLFKRE